MGQKQSKSKRLPSLKKVVVSDIFSKKTTVAVLHDSTPLLVALKRLADYNILSAPVVSDEGGVMGFIDVLDIVFFLSLSNKAAGNEFGDVVSLNVTCKPLIDFSKKNPLHFVTMKTPLYKVIKLMSIDKVHRVAVMQTEINGDVPISSTTLNAPVDQSKLISIITQSDLIALLGRFMEEVSSEKLNQSLLQLDIKPVELQCCKLSDITAEAYLKMYELGFSALGVLNESGQLVNFLSGSHIKGITEERLTELSLTVDKFLERNQEKRFKVFSRNITLKSLIEFIIDHRYHRVFFSAEMSQPLGLLTLTDLIREMAFELKLFEA